MRFLQRLHDHAAHRAHGVGGGGRGGQGGGGAGVGGITPLQARQPRPDVARLVARALVLVGGGRGLPLHGRAHGGVQPEPRRHEQGGQPARPHRGPR